MAYSNKSRPNKAQARRWLWEGREKGVDVFVTLASTHAECVQSGMDCGAIRKRTRILTCEKSPRLRPKIARRLMALHGDNFEQYGGRLFRMPLAQMVGEKKVDVAFFDICGLWDFPLLEWLAGPDGDVFKAGSKVAFTIDLTTRQTRLLNALKDVCDDIQEVTGGSKYTALIEGQYVNGKRSGGASGGGCLHVDPYKWIDCVNPRSTVQLLFYVLNSRYDVDLTRVYTYKDGRGDLMAYIEFTVNGRFSRNKTTEMQIVWDHIRKHVPLRNRRGRPTGKKELPPWAVLGCPANMTAGKKAGAVRKARRGVRPKWLKPQQWARCGINPNRSKRDR